MISRSLCDVTFERGGMGEPVFPRWPCPDCGESRQGRLQLRPNSIHYAAAAGVHAGIEGGYLERWDDYGVFAATMVCDSAGCQAGVVILGDYNVTGSIEIFGRSYEDDMGRKFTIKFVHKSPPLITIPQTTPEPIAEAVRRSFPLYWSDARACAGSVRIAIEETTDHLVPRPVRPSGAPVPLRQHLNNMRTSHPQHGNHIDAFLVIVEKLGNPGAHGESVDRDRLLDAYELLEIELGEIFAGTLRKELINRLRS